MALFSPPCAAGTHTGHEIVPPPRKACVWLLPVAQRLFEVSKVHSLVCDIQRSFEPSPTNWDALTALGKGLPSYRKEHMEAVRQALLLPDPKFKPDHTVVGGLLDGPY